ncbi:hypothetical protein BRY73_24295 [Ochrobactrum sp. P6BS-III]|nr:hypothetical protein F9K79_07625 [Ochrobactrum sp. Kaboul]OOL14074.1 hypothetical protein BRY73_24295 [Ochrobactrum sp. P6BS-III]TMU92300.1 hypothetical protein FGI60_21155 [Brucella haematophila]
MVLPWRARILVSSEGGFICRKRERDLRQASSKLSSTAISFPDGRDFQPVIDDTQGGGSPLRRTA